MFVTSYISKLEFHQNVKKMWFLVAAAQHCKAKHSTMPLLDIGVEGTPHSKEKQAGGEGGCSWFGKVTTSKNDTRESYN